MENRYITKDGKRLRLGYTTGSCAAAAAKAAAYMLLSGESLKSVELMTPKGINLSLEPLDIRRGEGFVSCAIKKDSGDDPDVTNGMLIYAKVTAQESGVTIDGGEGIGRITKPGLNRPVGEAAINSVPLAMITAGVQAVIDDFNYTAGLSVLIYAPEGEAIAKRTFNPRLGIEGGISILGTSGIVEPMSDDAVIETLRLQINRLYLDGARFLLLTPGNYGEDFALNSMKAHERAVIKCSNYIGETLSLAQDLGFSGALTVGHVGKLVKLAGGIMNTHSRYGDCRMDILAAHAGMYGADAGLIRDIMRSATTDEALRLLEEAGLCGEVMKSVTEKIAFHLNAKVFGGMETGTVVFSTKHGILGMTENARELLKKINGE